MHQHHRTLDDSLSFQRQRAMNSVKHLLAIVAFSCPVVASGAGVPAAESSIEAPGPAGPLKGTMLSPVGSHGQWAKYCGIN
jgi:hypothetical protein